MPVGSSAWFKRRTYNDVNFVSFVYIGADREGAISRGPDAGPFCENPVRHAEEITFLLDPTIPCPCGKKQRLWVRSLS